MLVRNIKYALKSDRNVYIGSGEKARGIARSPLAPPYEMRLLYRGPDSERETAERKAMLAAYKKWLWQKLQANDDAVWTALRSITANSVLLCYCHPKLCHGLVIRDAWTWAYKQGKIDQPKPVKPVAAPPKTTPDFAPGPLDLEKIVTEKYPELCNVVADKRGSILYAESKETPEELEAHRARLALIDARLDEEFLERYESTALARSLPPKKKQGRGAPRMLRALLPPAPDVRYNLLDNIASDLEELYTNAAA